jgi:C1A family cysteine protease
MAIEQRRVKRYGYIPDLPDHRDREVKLARISPAALPKTVSLGDNVGFRFPVYDQGELGSCTANAIGAAFEYELRRQKLAEFRPSRLAIYYGERRIEGTIMSDAGAMIRDGMKVIANDGAASESLWPYVIDRFTQAPSEAYATAAATRQCVSYERVEQTELALRTALAHKYPIIFGISVFESFESDAAERTGKIPMPAASEAMIGGHAILMTGYTAKTVTFRNSWGDSWGKGGYGTLPLDYVLNPDLADDFWILKLIEG